MHVTFTLCKIYVTSNFGNIASLIRNPFHIGNHSECGADRTEIAGYRLLLEKELHTQGLNFPFFTVCIPFDLNCALRHLVCSCEQGLCCVCNAVFALCTHEYKTVVEFLELAFKFIAHFSRTSL